MCYVFFFSGRRRHTRCALVTGVQTCALPSHAANGLGREPGAAAPLRRRDPIDEIERVGVDPCGDDRGLAHVSNVYIRYAAVNLAGSRPRLAGAADLPFVGGQPFECDRAACMERSEEHTSELQSLMRNQYAVFC